MSTFRCLDLSLQPLPPLSSKGPALSLSACTGVPSEHVRWWEADGRTAARGLWGYAA